MSATHQIREDAVRDYVRPLAPAQDSWELSGWEREQQAIEDERRARDEASHASVPVASEPRRRSGMRIWVKSLGTLGFVVGSATAGYVAYQMGYDWRTTSTIAGLVGVAGGAAGVMLPLLFRALGWTILAALAGSVGAAALYALMRLAPAFVNRIMG